MRACFFGPYPLHITRETCIDINRPKSSHGKRNRKGLHCYLLNSFKTFSLKYEALSWPTTRNIFQVNFWKFNMFRIIYSVRISFVKPWIFFFEIYENKWMKRLVMKTLAQHAWDIPKTLFTSASLMALGKSRQGWWIHNSNIVETSANRSGKGLKPAETS